LSKSQEKQLTNQQISEFRRRYGAFRVKKEYSELLLCSNGKGDLMGCLGVEVDTVKTSDGREKQFNCPLMSNVAVGRNFRRRGVAEELVKQAEVMVRKQWGYPDIYLYVEKQNVPAVRLYKKMGYKIQWEDTNAQTLVPVESGSIVNKPTTLVCMKKNLIRRGFFINPFG
jgi:GNAT superfamily N-acetyltransferase